MYHAKPSHRANRPSRLRARPCRYLRTATPSASFGGMHSVPSTAASATIRQRPSGSMPVKRCKVSRPCWRNKMICPRLGATQPKGRTVTSSPSRKRGRILGPATKNRTVRDCSNKAATIFAGVGLSSAETRSPADDSPRRWHSVESGCRRSVFATAPPSALPGRFFFHRSPFPQLCIFAKPATPTPKLQITFWQRN